MVKAHVLVSASPWGDTFAERVSLEDKSGGTKGSRGYTMALIHPVEGLSPSENPNSLAASWHETSLNAGCDSISGELPGSRKSGVHLTIGGDPTFTYRQGGWIVWLSHYWLGRVPPGISDGTEGLPEFGLSQWGTPAFHNTWICRCSHGP